MTDPVFIIAEAGVNHNGSLDLALRLVDVAAQAGADAVKFQTFRADRLATAAARKAEYQVTNTQEGGSQLEMLRRLELSPEDHHLLVERCRQNGIRFMSTAFDAESLALLSTLDMPAVKIPSGDVTCAPLVLQAARLRRPIILSTGMCTLADIEDALGVVAFGLLNDGDPAGRADFAAAYASQEGRAALRRYVTLLHCTTDYPAQPESVNLRAMETMRAAFGLPVGYSDHTEGVDVSLAAVALGASVIEKHFTLDRTLPGPDHAASLEPNELVALVRGVRVIERALGSQAKVPGASELPNRNVARRSIVAARPIAQGQRVELADLAYKRPGTGMSPMDLWDVQGRIAHRPYGVDDLIEP